MKPFLACLELGPARLAAAMPAALAAALLTISATHAAADVGDLYSSNISSSASTIQRITPEGVVSTFDTSGLDQAGGIAFDAAGNLYVANEDSYTIEKITPGGSASVFASTGTATPTGLAFDAAGNLFVSSIGSSTIEKYNHLGIGTVFASSGLNEPIGLAFDAAGNLYAANFGDNSIEEFTPGGVGSVFTRTSLRPFNLAFNAAGNLFVTNSGNIEEYNHQSTGTIFASTGSVSPLGLAIDAAGNVYTSNTDNTIEKFTSAGVGSTFAAVTGQTQFLAFQTVVPEPSTWAAMLLGVGGLLLAQRRGRRGIKV